MTRQDTVLKKFRPRGFECMCGNVRMAARAVTTLYDEHLQPVGLRATQLAVLWAVIATSGATIGKIAKVIAMDDSTLTRTLKLLERDRMISLRSGVDRRQKQVRATARGQKIFASAMPLWEAAQSAVLKQLKDRRLTDVNSLLLKLSYPQRA